jgi:hypothetical protein
VIAQFVAPDAPGGLKTVRHNSYGSTHCRIDVFHEGKPFLSFVDHWGETHRNAHTDFPACSQRAQDHLHYFNDPKIKQAYGITRPHTLVIFGTLDSRISNSVFNRTPFVAANRQLYLPGL